MEDLDIDVKFNPEHFREIYYVNGSRSVFTYKPARIPFILVIVFAIVTIVIYPRSVTHVTIGWILSVCVLLFSFSFVYLVFVVIGYRKWKNTVESFIRKNDQYASHKIRVTENTIEVIQDAESITDKWENIKGVAIEKNYIQLVKEKGGYFLFAAKSMNADAFENLVTFVKNKVK